MAAQLKRRSFLKFLSVSPAIFQALPGEAAGLGKDFFNPKPKNPPPPPKPPEPPKKPLSNLETFQEHGSVIISYKGKPTGTGGVATYNPETDMTTHIFTQSGTFRA